MPTPSPQALSSVVAVLSASRSRDVADVPYVELYSGRLQGVISSGSDVDRVYVSFFAGHGGGFSCSTNNNRPCGGLRGARCKHLTQLLNEAFTQLGAERIVRYLGLPCEPDTIKRGGDLLRHMTGGQVKAETGAVFSRFLSYLRFLELSGSSDQAPELAWFVAG